ncbi:MAG: cytochrome C biogenesis protein [Gammaproteobacteria bacterium]|nr:cytochrome C biogenesis protein [Gammaproteobacteria bacterium]|tara:strand:- start:3700 stop:4515 length:816 start_codon:yes stop_codon:yes gene_type:complete
MIATTLELTAGLAAGVCYLLAAITLARRVNQAKPITNQAAMGFALPGVVLHGLVAYLAIDTPEGIDLGIQSSAVLVTWVMAAFVLAASTHIPVASLLILVLPIALVALLTHLTGDSSVEARTQLSPQLALHVLSSIVAYSILFMAACQSLVLALQERNLRGRQGIALIRLLPPLETMETLLFSMLWAGIGLLSISIISGFVYLDDMFAQHVVHHTVLSSAAWIMYAVLLAGHYYAGWRGPRAVRWTLFAFALLVLGYFGSKFVLEIILQGQ